MKTVFETTQKDSATVLDETKIYLLKKQVENADFNYSKLNNIDESIQGALNLENLMPVFAPVKGRYHYYQFISTFKGLACCDDATVKDFHDILIIKTDNEKNVIDAYQYTLEWAEPPLQYDVYKSDATNIKLINNLDISALKLIRTNFWDEKDKYHKESGIIQLK